MTGNAATVPARERDAEKFAAKRENESRKTCGHRYNFVNRDYVSDLYGFEPRIEEIILSSRDGSNVLTPGVLAVAYEIYNVSVEVRESAFRFEPS